VLRQLLATGLLLGSAVSEAAFVATPRSRAEQKVAVASVHAGGYAGYALLTDGHVRSWGDNLEGQLGAADGASSSAVPVEVAGLSRVTAVAAGGASAYALLRDGTLWAWGDDSAGELGRADLALRRAPVRVPGLAGVTAVAAGAFSAYAIRRDRTAWAWGNNSYGQLGTASGAPTSSIPRQVHGLRDVVALAGGSADAYALLADGTVWAFGDNTLGQLGQGPPAAGGPRAANLRASAIPLRVRGLAGVVAIAAGGDTCYALRSDGSVWAWGDDEFGELGNGRERLDEAAPVRVRRLTGVVAIEAGASSGYALLADGTVWAWGRGTDGELGDGRLANSALPGRVSALPGVAQVAADGEVAFAVARSGAVWSWGADQYGQLGDGSEMATGRPRRVVGLPVASTHATAGVASPGSRPSPAQPLRPVGAALIDTTLNGVACVSSSDCWAVGSVQRGLLGRGGLAEHWDGQTWAERASPTPAAAVPYPLVQLRAVACLTASDCWAVGSFASGNEGNFPGLVEHWDGTRWKLVANPRRPSSALLFGVSCADASDCWAVGEYQAATYSTLNVVEHWNGRSWSLSAAPDPSSLTSLLAVTCVDPSDCWAVGDYLDRAQRSRTLVERWDGSVWEEVTSPGEPGALQDQLYGISCVTASTCWAAGDYLTRSGTERSLVERWDGRRWSIVASPNRVPASQPEGSSLSAVTCVSPSLCWAVGSSFSDRLGYRDLVERWDGRRWVVAALVLPRETGASGLLESVSCIGASACWAVGSSQRGGRGTASGLFLHWDGLRWSAAPSTP